MQSRGNHHGGRTARCDVEVGGTTIPAGDFAVIPPGHDAWTVGDEPCVVIDWQGFADYAKR